MFWLAVMVVVANTTRPSTAAMSHEGVTVVEQWTQICSDDLPMAVTQLE